MAKHRNSYVKDLLHSDKSQQLNSIEKKKLTNPLGHSTYLFELSVALEIQNPKMCSEHFLKRV